MFSTIAPSYLTGSDRGADVARDVTQRRRGGKVAGLDGDGLRIAACVAAKTGARPWRMTTADYLTTILEAAPEAVTPDAAGSRTGPAPGRLTDVPWDPDLAPALRTHGLAVPEERVADLLLDDLAMGMPTGTTVEREPNEI